jgi:hypothetical protein
MAQAQARQHSQDPYAQRGKSLTSTVQRLRGWVGSDPSKVPELADALVELTAHRLFGHGYAAAAADAQESVRRAADLLAAKGPIGPYTSISDAVRYVTAVVHLATIQVGMGMPDAAGRTIESLQEVEDQLGDELRKRLQPETAIWALSCNAHAALAAGDIASANAYADAALARLMEAGLAADSDAQYLAMDIDWLVSDCRWAAGRTEEAIMFLHAAKDRYDEVVGDRLQEPGRLSPARLERLAEPLFSLYRDTADRLFGIDEVDLGLLTRRALIQRLRGLVGRLTDSVLVQLTLAHADLASDLNAAGRADEAKAAADEAAAIERMAEEKQLRTAIQDAAREPVTRGTQPVTWTPLPPTASYAATTAAGAGRFNLAVLQADRLRKTAAWLQETRPRAHRQELERMEHARIKAQQREAERVAAERAAAAHLAAERAKAEEAERLEAERRAAAEQAERLERKRRRQERIEAHRREEERREAERREKERREAEREPAEEAAVDPAEAERLELESLQAEIDELERAEERAKARGLDAEQMARDQEPPSTAG